jgi:P27 family predicted phage terminase small subunit
MGVLTLADGEAIALYAAIYSQWHHALKELNDGLTVNNTTTTQTAKGTTTKTLIKAHPMLNVVAECQRQLVKLLTQFGMTPITRASLNVPGKAEEDPIFAFLDAPKRQRKGEKKA